MELIKSIAYNEDCRATLSRLPDKSVRLILQDPPYGVTKNGWDTKPNLLQLWPEWERIIMDDGAIIMFAQQPFASELILSNPKLFRYDLIWYKALGVGFLNAKKMPLRNHEHILVFYKSLPIYNPQMGIGERKKFTMRRKKNNCYGPMKTDTTPASYDDGGKRYPQSVLDFTNGDNTNQSEHPTQKPIDLMRYIIRTYSNEGDLIYDGYLGSGTTLIAAEMENRRCIGAELQPEYFKIIERRYNELLSKPDLFKQAS